MQETAFATCQTAADLSERLRPPQLAEQHRHELLPAREPFRPALRPRLVHRPLELNPREQLQKLTEEATKPSLHGGASWTRNLRSVIPALCDRRAPPSNAVLDRSVLTSTPLPEFREEPYFRGIC